MILYPTETLYALGVNALDEAQLAELFKLKGREAEKASSWLVRNIEDLDRYAELTPKGVKIAEQFLPGPLTLVLKTKENVPDGVTAPDGTIGFRISADPMAEKIIGAFMQEYDAPLTCTSANVSGAPTMTTPGEILQQFGPLAGMIDEIHDDGPRKGLAPTVVRVINDNVEVLREGEISDWDIRKTLKSLDNVG